MMNLVYIVWIHQGDVKSIYGAYSTVELATKAKTEADAQYMNNTSVQFIIGMVPLITG